MSRNTSNDTRRRPGRVTNGNVKTRSSRPHSVAVVNLDSVAANLNSNSGSLLERWMSRSVSAPCLPNRQLLSISRSSRANKTSTLRLQNRPSSYVEPNYREMIRKKKTFAQRSKSVSASAAKCSELPNGESLHAFITGARYNRAHHLDSRSLESYGLYIPRANASHSFVNDSGSSSSSTIQGTNGKATRNMSDSHFLQPVAKKGTGMVGGFNKPSLQTQSESDSESESMTSLDREVNVVFGPSHSSSSSSEGSEDELSSISVSRKASEDLQDRSVAVDTVVESSKENQSNLTIMAPPKELEDGIQDKVDVVNLTRLEERQLNDGGNKVDLGKDLDQENFKSSEDQLDIKKLDRVQEESEHDFISLEALKLTVDILQESNSSIASTKTDVIAEEEMREQVPKKRRDTPAPRVTSKPLHHIHGDFQIEPTSFEEAEELRTEIPSSEETQSNSRENIASDLTSKSSTIFVDMSNLMAQEKSTDNDYDCNTTENVIEKQKDS